MACSDWFCLGDLFWDFVANEVKMKIALAMEDYEPSAEVKAEIVKLLAQIATVFWLPNL